MQKAKAGDYVREEIHHIREGKHGARSTEQAIAIGLSKARRAGVKVKLSPTASKATRAVAARESEAGRAHHKPSPARSRAMRAALKREPHRAASHRALSAHARKVAARKRRQR